MVVYQHRSMRKVSGGRYRPMFKKKLKYVGSLPTLTKLGKEKTRIDRRMGGLFKKRLLAANIANVLDPKTKKFHKLEIQTIVDNTANRHFIRRNIMTKGAIIKTQMGSAKITSRPGQDGIINAILISS